MNNYFDLTNKTALVTGASSGLGAHFAKLLARHNAKVVVAARREDRLADLVKQITDEGGQAFAVSMDVTDEKSVTAALDAGEQQFGVSNIVINNAGVADSKHFLNIDEDNWAFVQDTNLTGAWRVASQTAQRLVAANEAGSIVNLASILGLRQAKGQAAYAVSKAAVVQLTKSMALDLAGKQVRVNALCPGYFKTEMNEDYFNTQAGQDYIQTMPSKRIGVISELDAPLLMLVSDAGSFVTGITLPVDGGHLVNSL